MPAGAPSADQISRILSLYSPRELAELLGPLWQERLRGIAADELAALGISPEWHVINPLINTHLQEFGLDRLKIPIGTSRAAAAEAIQAGISVGEGIGPIARRLVTIGATDSGYRARLIARTEVVRSANMGRQISWKASGLPGLRKRWLSALSSTTRDSHRALHNKTVPLDGRFEFDASLSPGVPGSASVPGDATHVAHAANCKCSSTAYDPEHGKAIEFGGPEHVAIAKARDGEAISWEQEAVPLIVKYYNNITDETLRILGIDRADLE